MRRLETSALDMAMGTLVIEGPLMYNFILFRFTLEKGILLTEANYLTTITAFTAMQ